MTPSNNIVQKYQHFFNSENKINAENLNNFFADLSDTELKTLLSELEKPKVQKKNKKQK